MTSRTWVILGATSIIAKEFAHIVAAKGHDLRLFARDKEQLETIAQDIRLQFQVPCESFILDSSFPELMFASGKEMDLFIGQSDFTDNALLTDKSIRQLIDVNILTTVLAIEQYIKIEQTKHHLIYLSSVAARRGRAKNSLYGGSKAAIEVYLQGLQQAATSNQNISIARLGYIDTKQTYALANIFYAAPPKNCALACWKAVNKGKKQFYFPFFWRAIMALVSKLPFFIYKKID